MNIAPSQTFIREVKHLDSFLREKLEKVIRKVVEDPVIGKPLKYSRGERVIRMKPFRLVYLYRKEENTLYLLKFEHRSSVYE